MPFNENGQFIRVHNWTEDKSNNIPISASRMDAEDNGFADGLSQTFLRDGSIALTGDLKAGNNKLTGLKNGTESTDAATIGQLNTVQGNAVLLTGDQTIAGVKTFTSSPVVPTVSVDDSSTKVATTAWVNTTGNNVVHIAGTETITGNKTFSNNLIKQANSFEYKGIHIQNTLLTKGTAPSGSSAGGQFVFQDKDGLGIVNRIGGLEVTYDTNGTIVTKMHACEPVANSSSYASISVIYPSSGNPYTHAPIPTDTTTTSGMQIATTGWVNSVGNNVVHLSDAETITGNKTFSGHVKLTERTDWPDAGLLISNDYPNYAISIQNTSCTKGTAPSDRKFAAIEFYGTKMDNYYDRLGYLECTYETNKETHLKIGAYLSNNANDTSASTIEVIYPASGNPYTKAPASDVNNSIVTTVNKSKSSNGYFKLGNGLIVQWGFSQASGAVVTVTLPTAFTTNNYSVVLTVNQNSANELFVQDKNSTSFTWNRNGGIGNNAVYWIAIGY